MITLRLKFQGKLVREYQFEDEEITIGRDATCTLPIDNIGVSRTHCRIKKIGQFFVLQDMKSNNGTFVRAERVTQWNLNNGDEFFIGKHSLEFQNPDQELFALDGAADPSSKDLGGRTLGVDAREMEMLQRRQAVKLAGFLEAKDKQGIIKKFPLVKNPTFFGKHESCSIQIFGWGIAQRHAMVFHDEACFHVVALVPGKMVFVNGEPVDSHRLQHEDRVRVGKMEFRFFFGSP